MATPSTTYTDDITAYFRRVLSLVPIAYYRFGESSGTTAVDQMGSFDGTYVNTPTLGAAGALPDGNTAVTFTAASSEHVTTPLDETDITNTGWSLEVWVKTSTANGTIVSRYNGSSPRPQLWVVGGGLNKARISSNDGSTTKAVTGTTTVTDGEWHHIVATYDGTMLRLYVDGDSEGTPVAASGFDDGTPANFVVGEFNSGSFFNGSLDEVAFYDYALSATEVAENAAITVYTAD